MKLISVVSYPFLPAKSGGQKGIALFYKYFSGLLDITIVGTKKNEDGFEDGYRLIKLLSDSPLRYINPFIFFRIRKLILEEQATHLVIEHPYYGWLGIWLKKSCRIKLIVHSHNIESLRWKSLGKWWWRILWKYEKFTHRQADYNFFIQDSDKKYAVQSFGLDPVKCLTVSFGTEIPAPPDQASRHTARQELNRRFQTNDETTLLIFNGAFGYSPNRDALEHILHQINPLLQERKFDYRILIMGLDIPATASHISFPSVSVLGFVENLEIYLKGADVFLNPVISGGGIKTKLVEALAFNLNAVSSANGAIGVDPGICNHKMIVCADGDWHAFADAIVQLSNRRLVMGPEFYNQFYWGYIAQKAADFIR